jgi:hypothetical protein
MTNPATVLSIALVLGTTVLVLGARTQAAPMPITQCPQTISQPGAYRVENNLTATGTCLTITTDFVTIDLAGFSMSGNGSGRGIVTNVPGFRGIGVRNGSISNFFDGIVLEQAVGYIIEGLRVFNTQGAGISAGPPPGIVRDNVTVDTRGGGIIATGTIINNVVNAGNDATGIMAGQFSVVTGNTVSNVGFGIFGGSAVISGNSVGDNSRTGISAEAGSTLIGNSVRRNAQSGFDVACPSNLTDNTAVENGTNIVLEGDGCHTEDNVAP